MDFIKGYSNLIRAGKKFGSSEKDITDTLITKILLGTLSCVPTYDRYFCGAIKKKLRATARSGKKSMNNVVDLWKHKQDIDELVNTIPELANVAYPTMKLLDMGSLQRDLPISGSQAENL